MLDEPMNGLDPAGIMEFRLLIRAFVGEGRTVVISSHLLDEIEKTCDAVSIVDQGQIIRQGNLSEMFGNPSGEVEIEVGDSEGALSVLSRLSYVSSVELVGKNQLKFELNPEVKPSQVNSDLVLAGVLVEKFSPTRKTLEDEFLSITSNMGIH
ncbi:ABC transporter ATP-binding protein [mine drainage metagenome]|uniref:ABC transporter ATP-binding protein n=1 Tax=mine drainage metagenome TaxID=410659 RepID=T0ZUC3_9ZZZZ